MNLVALVGNLATDPELRVTGNGKQVCTFRLAVSRVGSSDADFFSVVTWGRQAEVCKDYLAVGRRVAVDGRLHHSTWNADDGSRRSRIEVVAHRVEMIGAGKGRRSEQHDEVAVSDEAAAAEAGHEAALAEPVPTPDFALT
jgi:single-strand DNA-binding protein